MKVFLDALSRIPTVSIGTQAFIIGSMEVINHHIPNTEFVMLTANREVDELFLRSEPFNVSFIDRSASQIGTINNILHIVKEIDAVVCAWGDGYITVPANQIINKSIFLKAGRKPLILFPSSIGPFKGIISKYLAKLGLIMFDNIMARDTITFQYLKELKLPSVNQIPDTAFILEPADVKSVEEIMIQEGVQLNESYIGLNISQLLNVLFEREGRSYPSLMAELVKHIYTTYSHKVLLIPHQVYPGIIKFNDIYGPNSYDGDDRHAIGKVMDCIEDKSIAIPITGEYSAREYKGIIAQCKIFIGGRMHSIISAISSSVPAILIQYSHKAPGVMNMLNLDRYVWNYQSSKNELFNLIDKVWKSRQKIKNEIENKMNSTKKQVWSAGEILKNIPYKR